MSTDPALGDYIPSAPVDDEARKANGNLPGLGGVYSTVNFHLYHYAGNNPVKYTDPDGKFLNFAIGVVVGFISSTAVEVGSRMASGQSFSDAVSNTFNDPVAVATIAASTVISAATSGVSGLAVKGAISLVAQTAKQGLVSGSKAVAEIAVKTVAINTVAGAVDAGLKDITSKAIKGKPQNIKETAGKVLVGAGSAAFFSSVTQGVIANGSATATTTFSNQWFSAGTEIFQPDWADSAGVIGENFLPAMRDITNSMLQ